MAVVIFKAVERCNSNCIYCDVIKKGQRATMPLELLELVFKHLNEYLGARPEEEVTLTWHGGEVCLLGADYLWKALEFQERHCPETKNRIEHSIQSNMTLLTQGIVDALRALGIRQVGSSYDPIPHIRGLGRNRDSEEYNRRFMRGVNLLNENDMSWGMIYVVHRKSLPLAEEIFHFLTNLNLRSSPNFNKVWVFGADRHGLAISAEEFADFLGAIFPLWWHHRDRYPHVQPFEGLVKNIRDRQLSLVCECSGGCTHRWVYIGPEGNTSQCGKSGDYSITDYGRIQDRSLSDIFRDARRKQLGRRQTLLPTTECKSCRLWGICHGGCPLDAFLEYGDFDRRSPNCRALKRFVMDYLEPITGLRAEFPAPAVQV